MIVRRPVAPLERSIDRAFEQLTHSFANSFFDARRQVGPVVDGAWHEDEYVLTVDLPGVPADAVAVEVAGSTLTLGARTDAMEWQRSLRLHGRLDPDSVRAAHVDGRLTVRISAHAEPEPRRVQIDTTPTRSAIAGGDTGAGESADAAPTEGSSDQSS